MVGDRREECREVVGRALPLLFGAGVTVIVAGSVNCTTELIDNCQS